MRAGFLITARLKSTRLPKKIILPLEGREVIRWMIERIKLCRSFDNIAMCTSTNPQDDLLENIAREEKIDCFRGSEDDVLLRLRDASIHLGLDYAVNITADCPLVDFGYADEMVGVYGRTGADYITSMNLPHGFYAFGLKVEALKKACEIKKGTNTEVWGRYFTETGLFKFMDMDVPASLIRPKYRLTLDYEQDYEFFKALFAGIGKDTYKKDIREIIAFLDAHPEIVAINAHCEEWYAERWESQRKLEI